MSSVKARSSFYTIVLSGGVGSRMQAGHPKQFLTLAGEPVLTHSLTAFFQWGIAAPLMLVCPAEYMQTSADLIALHLPQYKSDIYLVEGGASRHQSYLNGLHGLLEHLGRAQSEEARADAIVLIHDAARPLVQAIELDRLAALFQDQHCQIGSLALPQVDTLVEFDPQTHRHTRTLDREQVMAVKTPQAIRLLTAQKTAAVPDKESYTDLLSFAKDLGLSGYLAQAEPANIKLTRPGDLELLAFYREQIAAHGAGQSL
ncbi:MAG: 2-C-methyl-D-erythritol 4-phosphate cytidylyltransferase [Leptospiraceae bacterium]|nr:2-C-methyl-D-erythritol 4-phosphate cytidylyltransferase [Leptospiraceae bacterium]